jgi:hypothetical protein
MSPRGLSVAESPVSGVRRTPSRGGRNSGDRSALPLGEQSGTTPLCSDHRRVDHPSSLRSVWHHGRCSSERCPATGRLVERAVMAPTPRSLISPLTSGSSPRSSLLNVCGREPMSANPRRGDVHRRDVEGAEHRAQLELGKSRQPTAPVGVDNGADVGASLVELAVNLSFPARSSPRRARSPRRRVDELDVLGRAEERPTLERTAKTG